MTIRSVLAGIDPLFFIKLFDLYLFHPPIGGQKINHILNVFFFYLRLKIPVYIINSVKQEIQKRYRIII